MTILFLKSILSIIMLILAVVAMFTMFEILGRIEKRFDTGTLRKIHKINGIVFFIIFVFIAYFCLSFIVLSKAELSARSAFHSVFALSILILFGVKISMIRFYRQFYNQAKVLGLVIALLTFAMVGISGGYYLLVTEFGRDMTFDKIMQYRKRVIAEKAEKKDKAVKIVVRTDPESIGRGKNLFDAKCNFCHNAYGTDRIVGPGLKGVLKKPGLPVSKRPAVPENIRRQLIQPFSRMPSFEYLSEKEVEDLIAFLNTL